MQLRGQVNVGSMEYTLDCHLYGIILRDRISLLATPLQLAFLLLVFQGFALAQTPSSTSLIAPSNYGQPLTLTATVSSGATGKVTFYDGVTILGVGTISGTQASITTVMLSSGKRSLRAYYQGDGTYAASSAAFIPQTVAAGKSLGLHHPASYPTAQSSWAVAVGDFNGGSKQDLVIANGPYNCVTIYPGNGDGTFQNGVAYNVGTFPEAVAVGDFNGDGRMDLAVANQTSSNVSILIGNGDGTFQPAVNYAVGAGANTVAIADFNGDGKADLAVGTSNGSTAILLGKGDGTFESPLFINTGSTLAVADFNLDGKADLLVGAAVLLGNGDGTFQAPVDVPLGILGEFAAIGDFNGDGVADILTDSWVLLGNGDGTFRTAGSYPGSANYTVQVADFDGDGNQDIAVIAANLEVFRGNGDGTFGSATYYSSGQHAISRGAAGDFNGDGKADLAIGDVNSSGYVVFLGGDVPDLTIAASHGSGFTNGEQGATYTVTVSNIDNAATSGLVSVSATLPAGVVAATLAGAGWNCVLATVSCTRSDALSGNSSYFPIILTVNIASGATGSVTSTFSVAGGGETNTANDSVTDTTLLRLPTTLTFTSTPNPSLLGQPVTMTAGITAGATGRIDFYDGVSPLGSAAIVSGRGTLTTPLLPSGTGTLRAVYSGDSNYGASAAALTQVVNPLPTNGFAAPAPYSLNMPPGWIGAADLNGDGKTDLITVNDVFVNGATTSAIGVLLGNGNGAFRAPVNYPLPYGAGFAVLADFNNDGKIDLVLSAGPGSSTGFMMLLGNGDGSFQSAQIVGAPNTGSGYPVLMAADLNGDGNLDLVALSPENSVLLFLGKGDGTFAPPMNLSPATGSAYYFVQVADMNGDGIPDLVVKSTSLLVFLGIGDGTFQPPIAAPITISAPTYFVVGDFNGDGKPDVAIGSDVLLGNGDGTLRAPLQSLGSQSPVDAAVGDFNGDGNLDLAIIPGAGSPFVLFGNADGTFRSGPTFPNIPGYQNIGLAVSDFNGDGRDDLAFAISNSSAVELFLGGQFSGLTVSSTHSGSFTAGGRGTYQLSVYNPGFVFSGVPVSVTDTLPPGLTVNSIGGAGWNCTQAALTCTQYNGVFSMTIYSPITLTVNVSSSLPPSILNNQVAVTASGDTNSGTDPTSVVTPTTITLAASPNPATLGQPVILTATPTAGATGTVLFLADGLAAGTAPISGGQATLTTSMPSSGLLYLQANYSGDGTHAASSSTEISETVRSAPANGFAPAATYSAPAPVALASGDFNHDGIPDLVTANFGANTVSVLLGRGDGSFGPNTDYAAGTNPGAVAVADFNNDGQPDIAVVNEFANCVTFLLGNADGTFRAAVTVATGIDEPIGLAASDFNGDGKADLLVFGTNSPWLLLGNGDGTFQPSVALSHGSPGAVGDFNRDGKIDFAIADPLGDGYGPALLGNGDGTFPQAIPISGLSAASIAVGDLNADGKPDIVALSAGGASGVSVFMGNGDGTFQQPVFYTTPTQATSILLADLNGDGELDVVALNVDNSTYSGGSVLFGNGDGTLLPATALPAGAPAGQPFPYGNFALAGDFNGDGRTDIAIANAGAMVSPSSSASSLRRSPSPAPTPTHSP
jgi:uncharacterized repeat protein (TIGR01451 family)